MMPALCVSFSDLGRIVRLLLLQSGYRHRTKVLGWLLPNFDLRNYMLNKVTYNIDRCNLLCIVSEFI